MSKSISLRNNYDTLIGEKYTTKKEILLSKINSHGASTKVCNKCKVRQSIGHFQWRDSKTKVHNRCDNCRLKMDQSYKTENVFRYIDYLAQRLFYKAKKRIRKPCYLTRNDFAELFIAQQKIFGMKCPYSGITMTYHLGKGRNLTNLSIDRFDSTKPYEKGNVIFCCKMSNLMKFDSNYVQFVEWCDRFSANKDNIPMVVEYLKGQHD